MAAPAPTIDEKGGTDWDTPYRVIPSSAVGEFSSPGTDATPADLYAHSFSETARSPLDGDTSRDQSKFPTRDAKGKQA